MVAETPGARTEAGFLHPRAREGGFFGAQDGRASINFRVLYQLIKARDVMSTRPLRRVESRCGAVAVGRACLFPPLSSGGASVVQPWPRFHIPLIEPDMQISRIRLSDKTSRLRPRLAAPPRGQAYETVVSVKVREGISPALASPDLVLVAQPPAQPHCCVVVERPIRFSD